MADVIEMMLSSNGYTTNQKKVDMYPYATKNYAPVNPLTVILDRIRKEREAFNVEVRWIEEEEMPGVVVATAAHSSSETTFTCTYADYLRHEDLLMNSMTDEYITVNDTTINAADTTVTIARGQCGSTAAAISVGDLLLLLPSAKTEGAENVTDRAVLDTEYYNYTQIVNEFTSISRSTNAEDTHFGPQRIRNIRKMKDAAMKKIERLLYWGQRGAASASVHGRTMGGLLWRLATGPNVLDCNGILTESKLDWFLSTYREKAPDSSRLVLLCPERMRGVINRFGKGLVRLTGKESSYGLNISKYTGAVELDIVTAPLMAGNGVNHRAFLLDMDRIALKWLKGRQPQVFFNSTNQRDPEYIRDKFEAELTMILMNTKYHGYIKNARN